MTITDISLQIALPVNLSNHLGNHGIDPALDKKHKRENFQSIIITQRKKKTITRL